MSWRDNARRAAIVQRMVDAAIEDDDSWAEDCSDVAAMMGRALDVLVAERLIEVRSVPSSIVVTVSPAPGQDDAARFYRSGFEDGVHSERRKRR